MSDANFNPAKDAPPQQDRSTDKAGLPASDRIEAAERGQMQAEAKAHGRDARDNRPADARGKDQPVEADRGDAASRPAKAEQKTEQQAEREAITTLPNHIGFRFDSSRADRTEVKRVLDNLSPEMKQAAFKDTSATIILTGRASGVGDAEHNMDLSQNRVKDVAVQMREMGVKAQIQTFAYGDQEAIDVGQDGVDNRDFRSVIIDVLPGQHRDIEEQTTPKDQISERDQMRAASQARLSGEAWVDSRTVKEALRREGVSLAPISEGSGPINIDEYTVTVDKMPKGISPEMFLADFMSDPNRAANSTVFNMLSRFTRTYAGKPPEVGDIYEIAIPVDSGSVMLVDKNPSYFILQTVSPYSDLHVTGTHPVRGAREFGFDRNKDGSVTFYTRGLDRSNFGTMVLPGRPMQRITWENAVKGIGREIERQGGHTRPNSGTFWRRTM